MTLRELLVAVAEAVALLFELAGALIQLALDTRLETYALIVGALVGALLSLGLLMELADFLRALGGARTPWIRNEKSLRAEAPDADAWGFKAGTWLRGCLTRSQTTCGRG